MLLVAFSDAQSPEAARRNGKQRLRGLPCRIARGLIRDHRDRVLPDGKALENVRELFLEQRQLLHKRQIQNREGRARSQSGAAAQPCKAGAAEQHHGKHQQADDDRRRKVALQHQQHRRRRQYQDEGQNAVAKLLHPRMVIGNIRSADNDHEKLEQLRGLKLDRPELQPALRALCRNAHHDDGGIEQQRDAVAEPREALDPAVVNEHGGKAHTGQSEHRPAELSARKIIAVVKIKLTVSVAGRKDHHRADAEQRNDNQQKRPVHLADDTHERSPLALRLPRRQRGAFLRARGRFFPRSVQSIAPPVRKSITARSLPNTLRRR